MHEMAAFSATIRKLWVAIGMVEHLSIAKQQMDGFEPCFVLDKNGLEGSPLLDQYP
jgi:hypothetical protein